MPQELGQEQKQEQRLKQRLSQQHLLQVKLLEMPLTELEESINSELDDNPALEAMSPDDALYEGDARNQEGVGEESFEQQSEREEREDALDSALAGLGRDDEMPVARGYWDETQTADHEEMVYGDTVSFYDKLKEQMSEVELNDVEREVLEYLIGSLEDDGYLHKDLHFISDELAIYHNIDLSVEEIERVLHILQDFDPAGIGARNLQECLLLQVKRKPQSWLKTQLRRLFTDYFEEFTKKHWEKIRVGLDLSELQVEELKKEIHRLNPKPGASLGETMGRSLQQITPDFIIDTNDGGKVTFTLNRGQVPELKVSPSFTDMVETYKSNPEGMTRQDKEALLYAKEKVEKAQGFIEAIRQRRHTLYITMKAIIEWQMKYFQEGDEAELKPMILKDIAARTGLDISTISRVSNEKYAQTPWGTFPLRYFFSDGYTTEDGEELSTRRIKVALRDIIEGEDKHKPLSDEALSAKLREKGFPVARRTVAKYREQIGVPVARLRKQ
ncbi:MAG: RNA polymerase factor sigma-54 [Prevotella sp.]|nr:RNA polymerase factor sigma-54 [Prevotella sp.]